jgi:hypothetical protein
MQPLLHTCILCARASTGSQRAHGWCPCCRRWLCAKHLCRDPDQHARATLTTRMALVSAASVAGMLAGAISVLVAAMVVGLGGELTVLCMLAAEMAAGALTGRHADRHMDAWLEARARAVIARRLPRARISRPGRGALRRLSAGQSPAARR